MAAPDPQPSESSRPGRRALATRIINETGGRAVASPVAEVLHPPTSPSFTERLPLERAPKDVVRRALGRLNRLFVNRAGGALLRSRRVSNADLVEAIHILERRVEALEAERAAHDHR